MTAYLKCAGVQKAPVGSNPTSPAIEKGISFFNKIYTIGLILQCIFFIIDITSSNHHNTFILVIIEILNGGQLFMDTRKCTTCKRILPLDMFNRHGYNVSGSVRISSECKDCLRVRNQDRAQKFSNFIRIYRTPCEKCGEHRWYVIDFHHRDPEKKSFTVARAVCRSLAIVEQEINKCDTLCKNCHTEFHYLNRKYGLTYEDYLHYTVVDLVSIDDITRPEYDILSHDLNTSTTINKVCITCNKNLPISSFYEKCITPSGIQYSSSCKKCSQERAARKHRERMELLRQHRTICKNCGNKKWYLLDFYQKQPSDDKLPDGFWEKFSIDKVMEELPKHDTLCKNCIAAFRHLERTYNITYEEYLKNDYTHYQ